MTLFLLAVLVGLGAGYLSGGRLRRLGAVHLEALPILFFALGVEVALGVASDHTVVPAWLRTGLVVFAYGLVGWWLARNFPGRMWPAQLALGLVTLGWAANLAPIAWLGAMPVYRYALLRAGLSHLAVSRGQLGKHLVVAKLAGVGYLGDFIPLRALATVASPGDFAMALGIALFIASSMRAVQRRPASMTRARKRLVRSSLGFSKIWSGAPSSTMTPPSR
jgi:hypothetical protein